MQSASVVEALDVWEQLALHGVDVVKGRAIEQLGLDRADGRLGDGVDAPMFVKRLFLNSDRLRLRASVRSRS